MPVFHHLKRLTPSWLSGLLDLTTPQALKEEDDSYEGDAVNPANVKVIQDAMAEMLEQRLQQHEEAVESKIEPLLEHIKEVEKNQAQILKECSYLITSAAVARTHKGS